MVIKEKQSFKQTEVGLLPDDWSVKPLSELLVDNPKYGIGAAAIDFDYNHFTYLRITDIDDNGNLIKEGLKSVSHNEAENYILNDGEIVFARTGASVGKSYLYDPKDGTLVYAGFLIKVKPNKKHLHSPYLRNLVNTKSYWNWVTVNSMRSGQPGINSNELGTFLVPLPPTLVEQKAIATALSDVDNLITNLDNLITKKKAIKQGAMQQLLTPPHKGGKRLAGFSGDWMEKKLGDICENISSGSSDTKSVSGQFPLYGSTGIIGFKDYFDYKGARILVARVGANAGTLYEVNGSYCVSDNTLMLSVSKSVDIKFMFYYLKKYNLTRLIFGSGQPLITGGQLKDIDINLPKIEEQLAISEILSDLDEEIEKLEFKKAKYQSIKQGMMQELLTGKTRLV